MEAAGKMGNESRGNWRAVLLDVGGTLIECRPAPPFVYAQVLSRWGQEVRGEDVAPVFARTWAELTQAHPPGLDRYHHLKGGEWAWWREFLKRVLDDLAHPAPLDPALGELFEAFSDPSLWHVFGEVGDVLAALRGRGLRLAVVSNWDSRLPELLENLGLTVFFDALVVSGVEGVEKPAREIFMRAALRLGVSPSDCVHAGDSPLDDYRGAESAGITPVLVDRAGAFQNGYRRVADLWGLYDLVA